ncbi:tetratricopeptide repeat protein [Nitrosospira lacus]|uniref:tetratricopeptide repeat protein n=1 Tax=Nitrosospira lacus TaxID=1288494 RepID=UPI0002C53C83|nr:tetratricopeptide repeat protein [Nitrosospira lacus]
MVRIDELNYAEAAYGKVKAIAESQGDRERLATAYGNLGNVYQIRGDLAQAEAMYRKSLGLFRELGATTRAQQVQGLLDAIAKECTSVSTTNQ